VRLRPKFGPWEPKCGRRRLKAVGNSNSRAKVLLEAELAAVGERLQAEARVPSASLAGGDFLDLAQGLEHQELARLSASRLSERAKRLQIALSRVSAGEYGTCTECGASIAPARLSAIPDVTTCVACQDRLERAAR
jgi:DnaK suppressor protein